MATTSGEKYAKQVRQDTRKRQDTKNRQERGQRRQTGQTGVHSQDTQDRGDRGDRGDRRGRGQLLQFSRCFFLNTNLRQYGRTGPESEKMKA